MDESRASSTDRRYYGVYTGIVVQAAGDDEGRVKLRFDWFGSNMVSDWCRVATLYAGNGYGSVFVPEKDDEVLVAFFQGDMRYPYVLGGLYNRQDKPPVAPVGGADQKVIRTKHGHQLTFDDKPEQAAVRVVSKGGHKVELDDAGKTVRVESAAGASIELAGNGDITLSTGGTITLSAGSVKLDSASVELGTGAAQAVLLSSFAAHTHAVVSPGATGPALPPPPVGAATEVTAI
ncbi:MAG TPA: phage baseplate assembly protein V [Mycobacteriales bacterium]|nr:phage baseplate assembly protein V [Mycobacteriales bacterium]